MRYVNTVSVALFALAPITFCNYGFARADTADAQLSAVAKRIATLLRDEGHNAATLKVDGPSTFKSSGPAFVKEVLGREIQRFGIELQEFSADVAIVATLKKVDVTDESDAKAVTALALRLTVNVVDQNEKPIGSIDSNVITIKDRSEVAAILGIPFETGAGRTGVDSSSSTGQSAAIVAGVSRPDQAIDSVSIVRAKGNGSFGIEIFVDDRARQVSIKNGLAVIELKERDECSIRLVNDAPFEVAAQLKLDGVDCFFFSPQKAGLWLIRPQSSIQVRGWQLDDKLARKFKIVPFEDSIAHKVGAVGDVGVISASFFRAYEGEIPADDAPDASTKDIGIGAADEFGNPVSTVNRRIGKIRASVPVRYIKPEGSRK